MSAGQRLPPIAPGDYTEAQREAAATFQAARGVAPFGPFEAMMHSPRLMTLASAMGQYLRYHSAIGTTLSELVILVTARAWSQDFEWSVHAPLALKAGIGADTVDAIRDGRRPPAMTPDETLVYDATVELQSTRQLSDHTWGRVAERFGTEGAVDLVGLGGYYTLLAMQLNAARFPVTAEARLPRFPL